ncbi:MAG: 50S ribosomal protein L25 [Candidatus Omnitrophota bacterium]|jgi:large subunit ribosomal protein L25
MEEIFLEAESRTGTGRAHTKDLKEQGFLPAVLYSQGKESLALKISSRALIRLVHQHRIEGVILTLKIKDDKKARACLVKEIQYDPVHDNIIHVDFNEISLTKEIKVNVPIIAKGESVGVKQEGGALEHILWEVEVECLPTDIPKGIEVDVTNLKIGDSIHIKDIQIPARVKVLNDPSAIILSVAAPMKVEVPAEAVEGEENKEPEVIKEKKEVPTEEGKAEENKEKEKK